MSVNTIEKLFVEELKDLYSAENQITKALPKLAEAASSKELQSALEHHRRRQKATFGGWSKFSRFLVQAPKGRHAMG